MLQFNLISCEINYKANSDIAYGSIVYYLTFLRRKIAVLIGMPNTALLIV